MNWLGMLYRPTDCCPNESEISSCAFPLHRLSLGFVQHLLSHMQTRTHIQESRVESIAKQSVTSRESHLNSLTCQLSRIKKPIKGVICIGLAICGENKPKVSLGEVDFFLKKKKYYLIERSSNIFFSSIRKIL